MFTLEAENWSSGPLVLADSFWLRLRGLVAHRRTLGLLIAANSVHGWGMTRRVLVVGLDRDLRVKRISTLPPFGLVVARGCAYAMELPAGKSPPALGVVLAISMDTLGSGYAN